MVTKKEAREKIKELVKEFSEYSKEDLNKKSENQIQSEFIDPLFEALGWDMRKDAEREERVLKGRADYILKIGNQESLVIEAKKTNVHLSEEQGRQAVSYAYHRKIKFSILTNFKHIRVYHALSNIKTIDKNLLFWLESKNFEKEFEQLWLISKESFEKQETDKLISKKDERKYKPIDESILIDLLQFRDWLSKDLKKLRTYLTQEQIDEVVQILIDRLIFMRSVEDRGLEEKDFLLKIVKDIEQGRSDKNLWALLKIQFKIFNKMYNSKLFFEGLLEKEGFFDRDTLIRVIKGLYYGTQHQQERYMFDEIPGDLLGNIYEQYLGTILRGTEKRVKLESGSGKRKKMGIYYTPSYIVDYIVKNTLGEYIKDKTIDEVLSVKIVDPACGSGSFLIRAFQEVCNIIEGKLKKREKSNKWKTFQIFKGRLSLNQKSIILKNCIYGVDLDEKAVELSQLNLLLKLLEDETRETRDRLLPLMKHNIKCGNSLIDDSKVAGDKAFNWKAQFPDVFSQDGGFDVVVGNPPYGAGLKEKERKYLEEKFKLRSTDTAVLFMGLAKDLLKPKGVNGFIVPKPFVYSSTWAKIREYLLKGIKEIVDCGKVWKDVKLEQTIYFYHKEENLKNYTSCVRENEQIKNLGEIDKKTFLEFGFLLNGISEEELKIGEKIKNVGGFFNDFIINQRGAIYQKHIKAKRSQNDFKVLGGKQLSWYFIDDKIKGYIPKEIVKDEKAFIKENSILVQRIVAHLTKPKDHIKIIACLSNLIDWKNYIIVDTINQLQNKGKLSSEFLLGIINSSLISWYAYRFIFGKAIRTMQFDNPITKRIPIPKKINKPQEQKIVGLVEQMLELQKKFHDEKISGHEKERLEQQIRNVDYEIDEEVYKLYGITKEEQKVVGGSLK